MDADLIARLVEAGVDPHRIADPHEAWMRLHDRIGRRATLIDRYALEEAHRNGPILDLPIEERTRIAHEVLEVRYPGIELVGPGTDHPILVVPYDEAWPGLFATWRERLQVALGSAALFIEHVGSTAVPGLAAKPVIDVQISVLDVEDEATYAPGIESLAIPLRAREPGHRYFRPRPGEPRELQVHVCQAGSGWERDHLLFRDFLRARPEARSAYAALKVELAERYRDDRLAYNEAKTLFILDALADANIWAEKVQWTVGGR